MDSPLSRFVKVERSTSMERWPERGDVQVDFIEVMLLRTRRLSLRLNGCSVHKVGDEHWTFTLAFDRKGEVRR